MKYLFSLFIVLNLTSNALANAIDETEFIRRYYPKMEEVLTHVSKGISSYCDDCFYGIAKKPEGYFLTIEAFDNNPNHEVTFVKVWDRNSLEFVPFDVSKYESSQRFYEIPEEFKALFNRANYYDFFLYYGYKDWPKDTRTVVNKKNLKSAEDLEILARAANLESVAFIHPGMGGDNFDIERAFKDAGYAKVSPVQRENFQKKANESLEYWKKIKREHPNYQPFIIDDLSLKMGDDIMHYYLLSTSIMDEPLAADFLKNAYYPEVWVRYAKNLLDGCDENGILFTGGDTDTYPLLYVQNKMGYRKDVTVINTSLLNTEWYWSMIQKNNTIESAIGTKQYAKLYEKPIYVDYEMAVLPFKQWLDKKIKENDTLTYTLAPNSFVLPFQGTNISIDLKTQQLNLSDVIVLDILSNNPKRPIFTNAPIDMVNLGLYFNMATTGRVFSIVNDPEAALESIQTLERIENLVTETTIPYLQALGSSAQGEISVISFLVLNIPPVHQSRKEAIVEKMKTTLTPKALVKTENLALIEAMNAFYEVMAPESSNAIRTQLQATAQDLILNTTAMSLQLKEDFEKLELLFSIYAHFRVQETPPYEIEFSEVDKKVLTALQEKVLQLSESPVVQERAWSRLQIFRMLDAFDQIILD